VHLQNFAVFFAWIHPRRIRLPERQGSPFHFLRSARKPLGGDEGLSSVGMPFDEMFSRVSSKGQLAAWQGGILLAMAEEIHILKVEKDGEDGLIVTFSDGTVAGYVVEELLLLRPLRERIEKPVDSN
jgi:hypothetical protein